jgi:hypothetical protein
LNSEGGFGVAGKDGAVADVRRDNLVHGRQRTQAKVGLLRIGIGSGSGNTRAFAVKGCVANL